MPGIVKQLANPIDVPRITTIEGSELVPAMDRFGRAVAIKTEDIATEKNVYEVTIEQVFQSLGDGQETRFGDTAGPLIGDYAEIHTAKNGDAVEVVSISRGREFFDGNSLQPIQTILELQKVSNNNEAVGGHFYGPLIGLWSEMYVNETDRVPEAVSLVDGRFFSAGSQLVPLSELIPEKGPLVENLDEASVDSSGSIVSGTTITGTSISLNEHGSVLGKRPKVFGLRDLATGRTAPSSGIDLILPSLGQSLNKGTVDDDYYAGASAYHSTTPAILVGRALMPSYGHVLPFSNSWTGYVGIREGKHPTDTDTVETFNTQMAVRLWTEWDLTFGAQNLEGVRTVHVGHAVGGRSIREFQPGGDSYETFMKHVSRAISSSRAQGRTPIIGCFFFIQGEADRAGDQAMTARQRAREMADLQKSYEAEFRAMTGQVEAVPMVSNPIQRTGQPSAIVEGLLMAAEANPDSIFIGPSNYALEYFPTGSHPSPDGYRRMGDALGRALVDGVFGVNYRPVRVTEWYKDSNTDLIIDVELPYGSTLVRDTSDDLIDTQDLSPGDGWHFFDKDGVATISSVSVVGGSSLRVVFSTQPDWGSLYGWYAHDSTGIGGALGGTYGPRGIFRADDGSPVTGITADNHSWLLPATISFKGRAQ